MSEELYLKLRKQTVAAIADYGLLADGDQVMVAMSGGKDSAVLLKLLLDIQSRAPYRFELYPVMLDQKQPHFDASRFKNWVLQQGAELTIIAEDTYSIVTNAVKPGKSFCGLCSRLRRGVLYNYAFDQGYNKLALGHHRDDLAETLLLNIFFNGRIASMPPKLKSDDGRNTVIRPLAYCDEEMIGQVAAALDIPVMPCNLCGSQENLQRERMKKMLASMRTEYPDLNASLLRSMQNVRSSQLLDKNLWTFDF